MPTIRLIHPIYLDVPMLVSFAAAMQGGVSTTTEVTTESTASSSTRGEIGGKFGLSKLFGTLFEASVQANLAGDNASRNQEILKESRQHTEASMAILLYDQFLNDEGYLVRPTSAEQLADIEPGALVEVAGTLIKNAVDAVIDYIDALTILSNLGQKAPTKKKPAPKSEIEHMRELLDQDRKRTPISNALLRCSEPAGVTAVLTLRTENLRDLTLSELHKNSVRVVGKITRVISDGETMSAFENYGLSLVKKDTLEAAFEGVAATDTIEAEFSEVVVSGPAVQILPLMVFV